MIKLLLIVIGKTIDLTCVKYSITQDEKAAYPEDPTPIAVLGEVIFLPVRRPVVDVRFKHAEIYLPKARKKIRLVTGETVNYT